MLLLDRARGALRYAVGLRGYLRETMRPDAARSLVKRQLADREQTFLAVLERGIYEMPRSPYRRLLEHAGVAIEDARTLVREHGLEGALERLYDAGVYVTLEEFKGRQPVRRNGLEFEVHARDFDNPLLVAHYAGQTSGSRGVGSRVLIDFDLLTHEAAYLACVLDGYSIADRAVAIWRPGPPDTGGMKVALRYLLLAKPPRHWFVQTRFARSVEGLLAATFYYYTFVVSRLLKRPLPRLEYVPMAKAEVVAHWLATQKLRGRPAILETNPSQAIRVCLAAREHGVDISGTVFQVVGEPYTQAKAEVIAAAGAQAINRYSMAEVGQIAQACAAPAEVDDLHLFTDKIAAIQRDRASGGKVPLLVYTTLLASCPKLMLNTESGDYATLTQRDCGCPLGGLGWSTHMTGLAAYDKLTSEGVTFMGSELYRLLEQVLPGRFGGATTDYQLVEEEGETGLPRVSILVRPSIGVVDEADVIDAVIDVLKRYPTGGGSLMTDQWRQGGTLRVVRRDPYTTTSAKVLPLHVRPRTPPP